MKITKPIDISKFAPINTKMIYSRVIFWLLVSILTLEALILSLYYLIFYENVITSTQILILFSVLGFIAPITATVAIVSVVRWRILLSPESYNTTQKMHELLVDLYDATNKRQLKIYYQPQISLVTNEIIGMEALLRWNHPKKGMIHPKDFIPLAEKLG